MERSSQNVVTALVVSVLLSGCASDKVIESTTLAMAPSPGYRPGPVYFLPKAWLDIQIVRAVNEKGVVTDTFTLGQPELLADTSAAYRIHYDPDAFSEDKLVVETNAGGIITSVNTTVESKAIDFAKKFQEFVSAATPGAVKTLAEEDQPKAFTLKVKIDPTDNKDIERVNNSLAALNSGMALSMDRMGTPAVVSPVNDEDRPSLWIAVPVSYRASLARGPTIIGEALVTIPDPGKKMGLNVSRAAFAKAETKLTATNGFLTKYDYSKGSEAVGAASIPVEAAKAIVSIPSALFQFKVSSINQDKQLAAAQKDLLESEAALAKAAAKSDNVDEIEKLNAQTALLNAQKEVLAAQKTLVEVQKQLEAVTKPQDPVKP